MAPKSRSEYRKMISPLPKSKRLACGKKPCKKTKLKSNKHLQKTLSRDSAEAVFECLCNPRLPTRVRTGIVNSMTDDEMHSLCEVVHIVLKDNLKMTPDEKVRLRPYKETMLALMKGNQTMSDRKKIIKQDGGFLPFLLPLLGSVLSGTASGVAGAMLKK